MSTADPNVEGRGLSASQVWLFATVAFPLQAIAMAVSVYLPQHYARSLGMDLAAVGAAFALVRLIDLPFDPLLGLAMDRTRTRWGRYRVWLLLGGPVTMAAIYMLFMAGKGIGVPYVMAWLLVMYLGTSMVTLAHSAWAAALAPSYNARSHMFGVIGAMGVAGMTLVFVTPLVATAMGGAGMGVAEMGWFILAAIPLAIGAAVMRTPEQVADAPPGQTVRVRDYLELVLHPSMGRIVLAMLLFSLGTAWEGALFLFYFTDGRGFSVSEASLLLIAALGVGLLGAPALGQLSMKWSKHRTVLLAAAAYALALGSLLLVPREAKLLACVPVICTGFLYAGFHVLLRSMTADVADQIRLEQRRERAALLFALITLAPKLAAAVAIGLTFNLMARVGYDPAIGGANAPGALAGLSWAYLLGPIGFVLLGGLSVIGYRLGPAQTAEIQERLAALSDPGGRDPAA